MTLRIGDTAPDFRADTTEGPIRFHEWMGDGWAMLFSHPKDFTPVCTTELGAVARLKARFEARDCKVIGLGVDSLDDHRAWCVDIEETQGHPVTYPIIADPDLEVAKRYGMLPNDEAPGSARTAVDNATVRTVFLIDPAKRIRAMVSYPMTTGRNFAEILRLLDSVRLTERHKVATPVDWEDGDSVFILPTVSEAEARERFPRGWSAQRPYMRLVPQPQ